MKFWESLPHQARRSVVLLQVDLGGHSAWTAQLSPTHIACGARIEFAEALKQKLHSEEFELLFWAGDGGVFAKLPSVRGFATGVCTAADKVFKCFENWKQQKWELHIRPDPGSWCSPEFNSFLKFERDISKRNAFVITHQLFENLDDSRDVERFTQNRRIRLPNNESVLLYIDSQHPGENKPSEHSFGRWLEDSINNGQLPRSVFDQNSLMVVGACTILDTAKQSQGYAELVLEPQQPDPSFGGIALEDRSGWDKVRQKLYAAHVSGISTQVTQFIEELTDDPARLRFRIAPYADVRAFHELLESTPSAAVRYREAALRVIGDGTNIPNILSTAVVVIIGNAKEPLLVIANRKGRPGGFHAGTWAVSVGEQFMPVTGFRGSREIKADLSVTESATRGLREELIADDYHGNLTLSIQAFALENLHDNYIFVSIADLRPLSFPELAERWVHAIDSAEHNAVAALPAARELLLACMNEDSLPTAVLGDITARNLLRVRPGATLTHSWQPNSHIRLAACLWYLIGDL